MDELVRLDETCALLEEASAAVIERRAQRDAAITAAFEAGVAIGAIAERVGLSAARVQMILGQPRGRVGRPPAGT